MDFQQSVRLQKIAADKQKIAQEIIAKKMNEEFFPSENLADWWIAIMRKAILCCTPITQRAQLKEFVATVDRLHKPKPRLSMAQMQIVANCLDAVSAQQLGLDVGEYVGLCTETFSYVETWTKLITKINDDATIEAEKEYKKRNPDGDKPTNGSFKPIIGKA